MRCLGCSPVFFLGHQRTLQCLSVTCLVNYGVLQHTTLSSTDVSMTLTESLGHLKQAQNRELGGDSAGNILPIQAQRLELGTLSLVF